MAITRTDPTPVTTTAPIGNAVTRRAGSRKRAGPPLRARVRDVAADASDARALIWGLEALGWAPREAGNIVAIAQGLRPARDGWTIREIRHLRFLRSIVRAGRIAS
jgi:hypothetical protein